MIKYTSHIEYQTAQKIELFEEPIPISHDSSSLVMKIIIYIISFTVSY